MNYENVYLNANKVRLVSTNFHQEEKWSDESFKKMISLGSNKVLLFPETAFGLHKVSKDNWFGGLLEEMGKNSLIQLNLITKYTIKESLYLLVNLYHFIS